MFLASKRMVSPGSSVQGSFRHRWPDHEGRVSTLRRGHGLVSHPNTFPENWGPQPVSPHTPCNASLAWTLPKNPVLFSIRNFRKILSLVQVRILCPVISRGSVFWFIQKEKFRLGFRKYAPEKSVNNYMCSP